MYCPECGRENSDQARFCAACGTPLARDDTQPSDERRRSEVQDAVRPDRAPQDAAPQDRAPQDAAPLGAPPAPGEADAVPGLHPSAPAPKPRVPVPLVVVAGVLAGLLAVGLVVLLARGFQDAPTAETAASGQDAEAEAAEAEDSEDQGAQNEGSKASDFSDAKKSGSDASVEDAGQKAASKHELSYSWSSEVPEGMEVQLGDASADVRYPVFAGEGDDATLADAINADVRERVHHAYDCLAYWKSWAYVDLYPEVTLCTDDYVAVHYYHCYNAGTNGTLDFAGEGAVYDLSDGGKKVSPAVLAGMDDDELFSRAVAAANESGVSAQVVYNDVGQMMEDGEAGYVVLSDGIYLYLKGANPAHRSTLAYYLVGVCELGGSDGKVRGQLVDLSAEQTFARYRDLDRSGTTSLDGAGEQREKESSSGGDDDKQVAEEQAVSYPVQTGTTYETEDFVVTFPSAWEGSWSVSAESSDGGTYYSFDADSSGFSSIGVFDSEQTLTNGRAVRMGYCGQSSRGKYVYSFNPPANSLFLRSEATITVK